MIASMTLIVKVFWPATTLTVAPAERIDGVGTPSATLMVTVPLAMLTNIVSLPVEVGVIGLPVLPLA